MTTSERGIERKKTHREKMGGYFLNLSQLTFAGLVVGGLSPLFDNPDKWDAVTIVMGVIATTVFAFIGHKILK